MSSTLTSMFTSLTEDLSSNLLEYTAQQQEQSVQLHVLAVLEQARAEQLDHDFPRLKKLNTMDYLPRFTAKSYLKAFREVLLRVLDDPTLPLHNNLSKSQPRRF